MTSYPVSSGRNGGHVGDIIAHTATGTAYLIRQETDTYFLVEEAANPGADFTAIRKTLVASVHAEGFRFYVFLCPHSTPVDKPLPRAAHS